MGHFSSFLTFVHCEHYFIQTTVCDIQLQEIILKFRTFEQQNERQEIEEHTRW